MLSVFVVPEIGDGPTITVEGNEAHHAIKVVRLEKGEEIIVTDGKGAWAQGSVTTIDKNSFSISVVDRGFKEQLLPELVVIQALTKSDRMKETIEMLTVAGADRIIPWKAERSIGVEKDGSNLKWESAAIAASKQSRRVRFPIIESSKTTKELKSQFEGSLIVLHESAHINLRDIILPSEKRVVLVVGPEGGITDTELEELGGIVIRLGDEVLRSAHAGFAALAAIQTLIQRW